MWYHKVWIFALMVYFIVRAVFNLTSVTVVGGEKVVMGILALVVAAAIIMSLLL